MGGFAIGMPNIATMSCCRFFAHDLHHQEPRPGHAISAYALVRDRVRPSSPCLSARNDAADIVIGLMGFSR